MTDKKFLEWVQNRLHYQYGADFRADWMIRLTLIIEAMPDDQVTRAIHNRTGLNLDGGKV